MKELFGILILFLSAISFTSCDKDDINELTPELSIKPHGVEQDTVKHGR